MNTFVPITSMYGYIQETKMEIAIVEIRAAEGGDDAKSLVYEQYGIYSKVAARRCL